MSKQHIMIFIFLMIGIFFLSKYLYFPTKKKIYPKQNCINPALIEEVELIKEGKKIIFKRQENNWVGIQNQTIIQNIHPFFEGFISTISNLDQAEFVSDKIESFYDFGLLDAAAYAINLKSKNQKVNLLIGNFDSLKNITYFRYKDANLIFSIHQNLTQKLSPHVVNFRNDFLPLIATDSLNSVEYKLNDKAVFGYNISNEHWCSAIGNQNITTLELEEYLLGINNIKGEAVEMSKKDSIKNNYQISFYYHSNPHFKKINIFEINDPQRKFYIRSLNQKLKFIVLDSASFYGKLWKNPLNFVKN